MLILSRKAQEEIVFLLPDGSQINVKVLDFDRGRVRLGLTAPATVEIYRKELLTRMEAAGQVRVAG